MTLPQAHPPRMSSEAVLACRERMKDLMCAIYGAEHGGDCHGAEEPAVLAGQYHQDAYCDCWKNKAMESLHTSMDLLDGYLQALGEMPRD